MKLMKLTFFFIFLHLVFHSIDTKTVPTAVDPVSYNHPTEPHHSLLQPLDQSQVYWNFGGSTVLSKKSIRLTPSTQDRRGWLWNEYPLEVENWEVEFKMEVFSKPHFGGDGMGFWVISGEQDPAFQTDPDILSGPIFGMRQDFKGFGVMFDVYDNDNRRDNPSVFVIRNDDGKSTNYNHDNDFANDMYTKVATNIPGMQPNNKHYTAHKCMAEFRNTGKTTKVLVKYLHKILHIYVDTQDGVGYKFCLAVQFDKTYKEYHIAFTAATGQVADSHDVHEIVTRYLADSDKEIDDDRLPHFGSGGKQSTFASIFWAAVIFVGAGLCIVEGYELFLYGQLKYVDSVLICQRLNSLVAPHFIVHLGLTSSLVLFGTWTAVIVNAPLALYRIYLFATQNFKYNPSLVKEQNHSVRLYFTLVLYIACEIYYLTRFSS